MADINQWKTGEVISASRLNEMVDAINNLLRQQSPEIDASNLVTTEQLISILRSYSDVGHTHHIREIVDLVLPTKLSQLQNDVGYLTEHQDISNKANKSEIPTKTSQLTNDSNFAVQPNFTFAINMIASTEQPSVTTTGVYPNLVITFNIPQGTTSSGGDDPVVAEKAIYYGRLSIAEVGGKVVQYDAITDEMIKNGVNITKITPQTLGKTSLGKESTTAEGDYVVVAVPKNEGYVVTQDNGFGGKVIFNKEVAGANGDYTVVIDGNEYALYGQILVSPAEIFIYIDKN